MQSKKILKENLWDHFVQGVLTVEDEEHILYPYIRLANGKTIHILYAGMRSDEEQEEDPLSRLLEVNKWYELLIIVQIGLGSEKKVTYSPALPPGTPFKLATTEIQVFSEVRKLNVVLQGIILDLAWNAASQSYLAVAGSRVYTHRFVLLETPIGKMVLSYQALQERLGDQAEHLTVGGYLQWEWSRLDLLAIVAKRDPMSGE